MTEIPPMVLSFDEATQYFVTALAVGIVVGLVARLTAIGRG